MSYLNSQRLHFSGKFQAAPSTVNNDPLHFNNQTFIPAYQQFGSGATNGWWNPTGDAAWRLIGCKVSGAWVDNQPVPASDPIHTLLIADSDRSVSAKLVDLDPEQQMVSEVWGMQVRICTSDGTTLLRSNYRTAPFTDIWGRAPGGGDGAFSATYQSVLTNLEWGNIESSEFLKALRDTSAKSGKLSIKFNVDGYVMTAGPDFTLGRIVGTIGPCAPDEPDHLVLGRHFMASPANPTQFSLNFCPALVDPTAGKIYVDLGNALPAVTAGGDLQPLGTLSLAYVDADSKTHTIDSIDYTAPQWYATTAGVAVVPTGRALTAAELAGVQANPLVLNATDATGTLLASIAEPSDGIYVRADQFVFRLQPGEKVEVPMFATAFGTPLAGARIVNIFDPSQLQPQSPLGPAPSVSSPESALTFPCRIFTGENGKAQLPLHASDPGNPRGYIDGQVYGVRPILEDSLSFGTNYPFNSADFISVLVFDSFKPDDPPTWNGSLQPIFEQYANLYPIMNRFLDMKDYDSVCSNVKLLKLAFSLPLEDPNSMPATRDLSAAKRAAILHWLSHPGENGKPLRGPARPHVPEILAAAPAQPAPTAAPSGEPVRGGKSSALSRRLFLQRRKSPL